MLVSTDYLAALWGVVTIILMLLVQWFIATTTKGAQKGAIPGKLDPALSHSSFVFRAHRTYMNTLENITTMLATIFLALLVGADAFWAATFIWVFVVARFVHMLLYYFIATEKNPSPRTYFFMMGLCANLGLFGLCIKTLAV